MKDFQDRLPTEDELRRKWRDLPNGNVGIALGPVSGLVRIDVDGPGGEALLAQKSGGDLPPTLEFTSGRENAGRGLLYAIPAGEWKGKRIPGIGEWIMFRTPIPVAEYERLAKQWNPVKFDAEAWVQLAKDAGMKYIVITSKHHDGFALYDSKVSRYDVVDATPFKRDILKELAAACAKAGIQ